MQSRNTRKLTRSRLSAALVAVLAFPVAAAWGQEANQESTDTTDISASTSERATNLDKVVVTGSLIPRTQIETFTPVMTISAEDIRSRGFTSVADVLQQNAVSTGGVQGAQTSASFTQGAETIGMFGLDPGYTKYLIDGRPMANYPALYNGSDTFNNISNIPVDLVERIEILPGGQSSLYGSDAIAGVVNIILKKEMDGAVLDIRGGWFSEGGGSSTRISLADGFSAMDGKLNGLVGFQYEERDPIWGYQRDLTKQFNTNGTTRPLASRDYLVYSPFTSYKFLDPANCGNVTGQFGGTESLQTRPGFGDENYCGSLYTPGYRTLQNGKKAGQFVGHVTFDVNDSVQLYGDVLYSTEEVRSHVGSGYTWWGTGVEWGYYYDPDLDDLVNLQRAFSPEDMGVGGFSNTMSKDKSKAIQAAFGVKGYFGESDWDYDFGVNYTQYDLEQNGFERWADAINNYFMEHVLGPQQGLDPYYGAYPVFQPDYAAFYQPISPEDFNSFTGYAQSNSKTSDAMVRAQVTNTSLFKLPGGDAGLAVALEWGKQKWDYTPDSRYLDGTIWGTTAIAGGGDRDRYAVTTELRMPIVDMLTVTASGRYDSFKAGGSTIDKPTYSLGVEFRPLESLMLRGKYGTAFRAPTLSDQFQGISGFYTSVTDYYQCSLAGFSPEDPAAIENCPASMSNRQIFGTQSGNTDLEPIDADVWNAGIVWAPMSNLSFAVDYYSWDISNEVRQQSIDALMFQEYRCQTGLDDATSPTCLATFSQVTRNMVNGLVDEVYTPKVNVSERTMEAATLGVNYDVAVGSFGDLSFSGNYTQILEHNRILYAGDPETDYLNDPYYSTDPEERANLSGTWSKGNWSSTLYVNWMGETPNYAASISSRGYAANNAEKLGSYTTFNASLTYSPMERLQLSFLVNNLLNEMPPTDDSYSGTSGAPYNSYNYNVYGRSMYMEMRYSFGGDK